MNTKVSGVILAGGKSTRLGFDKSIVPFIDRPLIAWVVDVMCSITDDCIIVTNEPGKFASMFEDVRFVQDALPIAATLVGIYSGLLAARYSHALVVGCDMPFLNRKLLQYLINRVPDCDVVIPRHEKGLESLHAVYSKACLSPIKNLLQQEKVRVTRFFSEVDVCYVEERTLQQFDPQKLSLVNINTPEDWEYAQALAWQTE